MSKYKTLFKDDKAFLKINMGKDRNNVVYGWRDNTGRHSHLILVSGNQIAHEERVPNLTSWISEGWAYISGSNVFASGLCV